MRFQRTFHSSLSFFLALLVGACAPRGTAPTSEPPTETVLAQQSQSIAQEVLAATRTTHESLLRHALHMLHNHPNAAAETCLEEARSLHHEARAAHEAGDTERAAALAHAALRKVLCAVIAVFPDAPARTGSAADHVIVRIEEWLGNHEAPHIRQVLAQVKARRAEAETALTAGDAVEALALNLRVTQILHRLANHLAEGHDHDAVATSELYTVDY